MKAEQNNKAIRPSLVALYSLGWIFHVTDSRFETSIYSKGLVSKNRDSLHFIFENDGSAGNIRKGAGTKAPRHYSTTIYCVLRIHLLIRGGYDLFLTSMVLFCFMMILI